MSEFTSSDMTQLAYFVEAVAMAPDEYQYSIAQARGQAWPMYLSIGSDGSRQAHAKVMEEAKPSEELDKSIEAIKQAFDKHNTDWYEPFNYDDVLKIGIELGEKSDMASNRSGHALLWMLQNRMTWLEKTGKAQEEDLNRSHFISKYLEEKRRQSTMHKRQ